MKSIRNKIAKNTLIITFFIATGMALYGTLRIESLLGSINQRYIESLGNEIALEVDAYMNHHMGYLEGQVKSLIHTNDYSKSFMQTFTKNMADGQDDVLYVYFRKPQHADDSKLDDNSELEIFPESDTESIATEVTMDSDKDDFKPTMDSDKDDFKPTYAVLNEMSNKIVSLPELKKCKKNFYVNSVLLHLVYQV